ncbi:hypothetical protein PCE1_001530 [Barthelona sp. PCE]
MATILWKFPDEIDRMYREIPIRNSHVSCNFIKTNILSHAEFGTQTATARAFDLKIVDAGTKKEYEDQELIERGSKLLITRKLHPPEETSVAAFNKIEEDRTEELFEQTDMYVAGDISRVAGLFSSSNDPQPQQVRTQRRKHRMDDSNTSTCMICRCTPTNPATMDCCGALGCSSCLNRVVHEHRSCPNCRFRSPRFTQLGGKVKQVPKKEQCTEKKIFVDTIEQFPKKAKVSQYYALFDRYQRPFKQNRRFFSRYMRKEAHQT